MSTRQAPVLQGMSDTMVERLQEASDSGTDPLHNVPLHGLLFSMHRADLHAAPELAAELALYNPAGDAPAPSIGRRPTIAERVAYCVSVMTRCHEGFGSKYPTGAADTARRRLMDLVMSYPVLPNPALNIEFREWGELLGVGLQRCPRNR